ncbi:hypothetical protein Tco_1546325 [Tanacetum coccineum]
MVLQFWEILLDVAGVTIFIACPSLLILVFVVVSVVGIDPTISDSMAIPLAFSTLGCTLPSMVVIALGAQRNTKSMLGIIQIGLQGDSKAGIASKKHKQGFMKGFITQKKNNGKKTRR